MTDYSGSTIDKLFRPGMDPWPGFYDEQSIYLFRLADGGRGFTIKTIPNGICMVEPSYREHGDVYRLLDDIPLYCSSEEDLFDTVMRCVSPTGIRGADNPGAREEALNYARAFLASLCDHADRKGVTRPDRWWITEGDQHYSVAHVLSAFNFKSLAMLSLPAYAALEFSGEWVPVAPGDSEHAHVLCPIHTFRTPSRSHPYVRNFEDYFEVLIHGGFENDNSFMFLVLYGLAQGIDILVRGMNWEGMNGFEGLLDYGPFVHTMNALVSMGAMHNPFTGSKSWPTCPSGIENARETNPNLAETVRLAKALTPMSLSPFYGDEDVQILYGLIRHFNLMEYFGIDRSAAFRFPANNEMEAGHALIWKAGVSPQTSSIEAQAVVPGVGKAAVYVPGQDIAPHMHVPLPDDGGRFWWVWMWDSPAVIVDSERGAIHIQGLKQTLEQIDDKFAASQERSHVYIYKGLSVISSRDFHESLRGVPEIAEAISRKYGVDPDSKTTSVKLDWELIEDSDCAFCAHIPNGFNRIYWYPKSMQCPALDCIKPGFADSGKCYIWDLANTTLEDSDGKGYRARGVRQLCLEQCPDLLEELQQEAFAFMGLAVIPSKVADQAISEATGKPIHKSMFGF